MMLYWVMNCCTSAAVMAGVPPGCVATKAPVAAANGRASLTGFPDKNFDRKAARKESPLPTVSLTVMG